LGQVLGLGVGLRLRVTVKIVNSKLTTKVMGANS
jgi:hypothetical protein